VSTALFSSPETGEDAQVRTSLPMRLLTTEIEDPIPAIVRCDATSNTHYDRAISLIRLHGRPLGVVDLDLRAGDIGARQFADQIWMNFSTAVNDHLRQDGLAKVSSLPMAGLTLIDRPACMRQRDVFLENPPTITVVIPTRERPEHLESCLRSILSGSYPQTRYDVVVVDNAPTSNRTLRCILDLHREYPCLSYVREPQRGGAAARNAGLQAATGDLVAFADDDVIVDVHWLTELARGFNLTSGVACVTGMILPLELETPAQVWLEGYGGFSKGFERRLYDLVEHRPESPLFPYTAGMLGSGASMAFKRSTLIELGAFDTMLGTATPTRGGEDIELLFRTVLHGHVLVYEPAAIVRHRHGRDYAGLRRQVYGYGVGLGAFLAKSLTTNPRLIPDFCTKLPRGLWFAVSPNSSKNLSKSFDYPRELSLLEFRGMLYGPLAYLRSRVSSARATRELRLS